MNKKETDLNKLVIRIEKTYRNDNDRFNERLGTIGSKDVRKVMKKHRIGMQCKKCLNKGYGRYCSARHSTYYRAILRGVYGMQIPAKDSEICPLCNTDKIYAGYTEAVISPDHIIPITKGGLEFDRNNLQYTHLSCNLKKGNRTQEEKEQREKTKKELLKAIIPALKIAERVRRYEEAKQKRLFEAVGLSPDLEIPSQPKGE